MAKVGSNDRINIIVQINEPGILKKTQRLYIEQNKAYLLNKNDVEQGKKLDSGHPETLSNFVVDTIEKFPAKHHCLILANHGSGILNPTVTTHVNPNNIYTLDATAQRHADEQHTVIQSSPIARRGICFDNSYGSYLTDADLDTALTKICATLPNKKIDIIGLDACWMGMIECGNVLKKYADIMIASQEVEFGFGWYYDKILAPFLEKSMNPNSFARHIIECYHHYQSITDDYTLSAIDLTKLDPIEQNIDQIAAMLQRGFASQQQNATLRTAVQHARDKHNCTTFEEPTYVDIGHWYSNLQRYLTENNREENRQHLITILNNGMQLLQEAVIAKALGKNFRNCSGLSIYFPERSIHSSYLATTFAKTNSWSSFLPQYVKFARATLLQIQ